MPRIRDIRLLINCRADTKAARNLCANIKEIQARELLKKSFERMERESSHWSVKNTLGSGSTGSGRAKAAIVHSHVVLLTCSLLLIMKKRLRQEQSSSSTNNYSIAGSSRWVRDRYFPPPPRKKVPGYRVRRWVVGRMNS